MSALDKSEGEQYQKQNSLTKQSASRLFTLANDPDDDLYIKPQTRLLNAYSAIAESRNVDSYKTADAACEPLRYQLFLEQGKGHKEKSSEEQDMKKRQLVQYILKDFNLAGENLKKVEICFAQMLKNREQEVIFLPKKDDEFDEEYHIRKCKEVKEHTWSLLTL